ncbi:15603_t:CDS:2 [Entrophospora sp. SA101]|nr:15603_t:CDS:2 [Entrophospora sp. SA101]
MYHPNLIDDQGENSEEQASNQQLKNDIAKLKQQLKHLNENKENVPK